VNREAELRAPSRVACSAWLNEAAARRGEKEGMLRMKARMGDVLGRLFPEPWLTAGQHITLAPRSTVNH